MPGQNGSQPILQSNPDEPIDLKTLEIQLLPQKLEDFQQASTNIDQIAAYCRSLYASPNIPRAQYEEALTEMRGYAEQSITSLSYQIASAAETLQHYLNEQMLLLADEASELEKISTRLASVHKLNGMKATQVPLRERNSSDVKQYKLEEPIIKLSDLKPAFKFDLYAYDSIGVCLATPASNDDGDDARSNASAVDRRTSGADSVSLRTSESIDKRLGNLGNAPSAPSTVTGTLRRSSTMNRQSLFGRPPPQASQVPIAPSLGAKAKPVVVKPSVSEISPSPSLSALAPPPPPPPPPPPGGAVVRPPSFIDTSAELKSNMESLVPADRSSKPGVAGFNLGDLQNVKLKSTGKSRNSESSPAPSDNDNGKKMKSAASGLAASSPPSENSNQTKPVIVKPYSSPSSAPPGAPTAKPPIASQSPTAVAIPATPPVQHAIKPETPPPQQITGVPMARPSPATAPTSPLSRPSSIAGSPVQSNSMPRPSGLPPPPPLSRPPSASGNLPPPPTFGSLSRPGSIGSGSNFPAELPKPPSIRPPILGATSLPSSPRPSFSSGIPKPGMSPAVKLPPPPSAMSRQSSVVLPPPPIMASPAMVRPPFPRTELSETSASAPASFPPPLTTAAKMPLPASKEKFMQAEYDFVASESDEMSLNEGDIIKIITVLGDGWIEGRVEARNVQGLFPANYAKPI